jgi:hypothetical protein
MKDNQDFAILRGVLPRREIDIIRRAAAAFYAVAEQKEHPPFPRAYLYNPGNMAVGMAALDDYGTTDYLLLRTVANSAAAERLRHFLGDDVVCSLTHSRMRKSYPQSVPDHPRPSTVAWHSDGDPHVGYFRAYVLWVPFTPCNDEYPGLEFQGFEWRPRQDRFGAGRRAAIQRKDRPSNRRLSHINAGTIQLRHAIFPASGYSACGTP